MAVAWLLLIPLAAGSGYVDNVQPVIDALQVVGPADPGAADVLVGEAYDANGEEDLVQLAVRVGGIEAQWALGDLPTAEPAAFADGWKVWDPAPADGRISFAYEHTYLAAGAHDWWVEARDESSGGDASLAVHVCTGDDDADADGVPDACDPEVNGVGGDGSASRYRIAAAQPAPEAVLDLTPSVATGSRGDFLAPSKAMLRDFAPGSVDGFRLDVTTRMAPPADPGGEVDQQDLLSRVTSSAQTLVVDVVVEGMHNGQPIAKASEVLASLDLRLSIPAAHFEANQLATEGATLHEYTVGTYVRSIPLGAPVAEDDAFVYEILLVDFSSFVFEAPPLDGASGGGSAGAGGSSGGGSGGGAGGGSGGGGGAGGGDAFSEAAAGDANEARGGGCPISDLLPGIRTCGTLVARDEATGPQDSLFHTIRMVGQQSAGTYFSYRFVEAAAPPGTTLVAAFELAAAAGSPDAAFSLRVPGTDAAHLVLLHEGRPVSSSQAEGLLDVRLTAPGTFIVVHDPQAPRLSVDWSAYEVTVSDNLPGVRWTWWIDGVAAGSGSHPDRLPLTGQTVEVAATDAAGHQVRARHTAAVLTLPHAAAADPAHVAWLAIPLLLAASVAWRTRGPSDDHGFAQRLGRSAAGSMRALRRR